MRQQTALWIPSEKLHYLSCYTRSAHTTSPLMLLNKTTAALSLSLARSQVNLLEKLTPSSHKGVNKIFAQGARVSCRRSQGELIKTHHDNGLIQMWCYLIKRVAPLARAQEREGSMCVYMCARGTMEAQLFTCPHA
jgi:hypothetical protein